MGNVVLINKQPVVNFR